GSFISSFSSPGGRDEDLACDNINFLPYLVIWSRDAYNNTIDAIEVGDGTCKCAPFLGINELFSSGVSVYPNPATQNFTIKTNALFKNARVDIFSTLGEKIYTVRIVNRNSLSVNSDFSP